MKKKLLSLLLIGAILLATLPIGVGAAATTEIVDGTSYTAVSSAEELYNALVAGGNILLKNDIKLNLLFSKTIMVYPGTVLNGNGHRLIYSNPRYEPLFRFAAGTKIDEATSYIKNIGFGTQTTPMVLTGDVSLFTEESADTCRVIYRNVDFYLKGENLTGGKIGGVYSNLTGVASFFGCTLNAQFSSSDTGALLGGWFGEVIGGDLVMTDCVTEGMIQGKGLCTAAYMGQAHIGNARFTNCTNLAQVSGVNMTAGFVGNVGTGSLSLYFTNCKNYGNITSSGSGYNSAAGGIMARSSNRRDQGDNRLRVFYDCVNYGSIVAGGRAGGIVGTSHDYDTNGKDANYAYYTYENCFNYGSVTGIEYAGGIMGIASPATYRAEITDCVNVGKITSSKGYAGNFAGMLCAGVITGGYAAGVVSSKQGSDPLVAQRSGNYTMQEGDFAGQKWTVKAPTVSGVTYIGNATPVDKDVTKIQPANLAGAIADLSAYSGVPFFAADASDSDAYVVLAEPMFRGVQRSVTLANGCADLRFTAGVHATEAYQTVGFYFTVLAGGKATEQTVEANGFYGALSTVGAGGQPVKITADRLAGNYLYTATLSGLSISEDAVIVATPFARDLGGNEYVGSTRVLSFENGTCRLESMLLNNVLLRDYAIIYSAADKLSEKLLATRMADEIAKLTGVSIPVYSDTQTCTNAARILVGKTTKTTVTVTDRTICTQKYPYEIVISGADTAQLSEAITYFLDTIEAKLVANDNVWSFDTSVTVPVDTTVTYMAYNMGAKNYDAIKKAEWELIVDYLPDIWTSQEPWAGFLDDFLNDYAVKPATKFVASTDDDDVMVSDVNNKAFTGDGYYGVYWGLPRWVPGDDNTNGKASYSVILYAKDRFTPDLSRSGTFWLSEKVNVSGTAYSGSDFPRCATYLTLTDRNTQKTFTVVNVHLDFVPEVQLAQIEIMLRELKARVGEDMTILVSGDMNSTADSDPIALYRNNEIMPMTALDDMAERVYRQYRNIDWFFVNKPETIEVSYYNNCSEHTYFNNHWNSSMVMGMPSDHPAIYTEFKFR